MKKRDAIEEARERLQELRYEVINMEQILILLTGIDKKSREDHVHR